jgi:hypothetical protein
VACGKVFALDMVQAAQDFFRAFKSLKGQIATE